MKKLLLLTMLTINLVLTAQVPGCATLTSPANGATNVEVYGNPLSVSLSWTAPTTGGAPTGYKIRWGTSIAGLTVLGNASATATSVTITSISLNTTYYWQALPFNATGDATGCSTIFSLTTASSVNTNCLVSSGGLYPTATYTPATCNGLAVNTIVTDAYAGEYTNVNVTAGQTYRFQSSIVTDYIKVSTTAAPTVIAASGTTPVTWTATATEVVKFYIHTDNICSSQATNRTRSIVCGATLKVDSFDASIFAIYPNPVNDILSISNSENINIKSISITDLNGRVVKNNNFNNVSNIEMNLSDLSSGMYIMNINSDQGTATKKIVKE
jgi:Secretion system C-terminal sorting domain